MLMASSKDDLLLFLFACTALGPVFSSQAVKEAVALKTKLQVFVAKCLTC